MHPDNTQVIKSKLISSAFDLYVIFRSP